MTTSTDGAPPSVAPEPDEGSEAPGDSSPRSSPEDQDQDDADEAPDRGPSWVLEEIQRRIAEGGTGSGGRHARRDSVSPGSAGYVPRHSVATPGPGAPRPGPVGGSPSPQASELLRRERTAASPAATPGPTAWSGPPGQQAPPGPNSAPPPGARTGAPSPVPRPTDDDGGGTAPQAAAPGPPPSTAPPRAPSPRPRPLPAGPESTVPGVPGPGPTSPDHPAAAAQGTPVAAAPAQPEPDEADPPPSAPNGPAAVEPAAVPEPGAASSAAPTPESAAPEAPTPETAAPEAAHEETTPHEAVPRATASDAAVQETVPEETAAENTAAEETATRATPESAPIGEDHPTAQTTPVRIRPRPVPARPPQGPRQVAPPPAAPVAEPPAEPAAPDVPDPSADEQPDDGRLAEGRSAGDEPAEGPSGSQHHESSTDSDAIEATTPTAAVVSGHSVLSDPVFTARTPEPGSREWQVLGGVRVPEQRGSQQGHGAAQAGDPNDLQSRRVRVVLAERRGVARPVRTVVDIQEGTGVGEFLRNDLIKTQLSIALRFAAGAALTLGLLPLLFAVVPEVGRIDVLGIRLPWLLLGLLVYPFLFGIGLWHSRLAEKVEQNFADHVQD